MKKFFFFALISSLFLLGCPSDGYIDDYSGKAKWESYPSDNSPTPNPGRNGSCTIQGNCYDDVSQSDCFSNGGNFSTSVCPSSPSSDMYCYNYDGDEDCVRIGSSCGFSAAASESACLSTPYGTIQTRAWCIVNASIWCE
jgi:hypothetical protein